MKNSGHKAVDIRKTLYTNFNTEGSAQESHNTGLIKYKQEDIFKNIKATSKLKEANSEFSNNKTNNKFINVKLNKEMKLLNNKNRIVSLPKLIQDNRSLENKENNYFNKDFSNNYFFQLKKHSILPENYKSSNSRVSNINFSKSPLGKIDYKEISNDTKKNIEIFKNEKKRKDKSFFEYLKNLNFSDDKMIEIQASQYNFSHSQRRYSPLLSNSNLKSETLIKKIKSKAKFSKYNHNNDYFIKIKNGDDQENQTIQKSQHESLKKSISNNVVDHSRISKNRKFIITHKNYINSDQLKIKQKKENLPLTQSSIYSKGENQENSDSNLHNSKSSSDYSNSCTKISQSEAHEGIKDLSYIGNSHLKKVKKENKKRHSIFNFDSNFRDSNLAQNKNILDTKDLYYEKQSEKENIKTLNSFQFPKKKKFLALDKSHSFKFFSNQPPDSFVDNAQKVKKTYENIMTESNYNSKNYGEGVNFEYPSSKDRYFIKHLKHQDNYLLYSFDKKCSINISNIIDIPGGKNTNNKSNNDFISDNFPNILDLKNLTKSSSEKIGDKTLKFYNKSSSSFKKLLDINRKKIKSFLLEKSEEESLLQRIEKSKQTQKR